MRALITGITGFVGSHLAELLLKKGNIEVYGTKRWRSPLDNITAILNDITLIDCDLRDATSVSSAVDEVKPDRIFHLAAQSYVPASFGAPRETLETNIIGTLNLLEAVRQTNIAPIIHICSSSEVYGQVTQDEIPIREENPLRPSSPYAVSKVAEDLLSYQYFLSYGLKTIRSRAFTHTGPRRGEVFVASAFSKQVAEIEKGLKPPVLFVGNLDSVRTFLDVRDITEAYWLLTEKCIPGEVYNIGGRATMRIDDLLQQLLAMSTRSINVEVDPKLLRPSDVTLQIPCIDKFVQQTGWEPKIPLEQTLADLLNFWRVQV